MDALLSEEQQALQEMATELADDIGIEQPHDLQQGPTAAGWHALARSGLLGMRVPESLGGAGASGVEIAVVTEQLGRVVAREPFLGSAVFATELARLVGAEELLEALGNGARRACVGLAPTLDGLARAGDSQAVAWDAAGCEQVLVLDGADVVALDLALDPVASIDLTRTLHHIEPSARSAVIGTLTPEALTRWSALALVGLAADLVGVMDGAVNRAVRYACEREQFGAPIGSFQAIAHLLADQAVSVATARSAMHYAAWCIDEVSPELALRAARTAKAFAAEAARPVTEAGIQVHGGIGITWECMAHVYLRRALMSRQVLGDEAHQLRRLSEERGAA